MGGGAWWNMPQPKLTSTSELELPGEIDSMTIDVSPCYTDRLFTEHGDPSSFLSLLTEQPGLDLMQDKFFKRAHFYDSFSFAL